MGAEESKPHNEEYKKLVKDFHKQRNYVDHRYGQAVVYGNTHNPNDKLLMKEKWTNSMPESAELVGFVESRRHNKHKNLAELKAYETLTDDQWCSTFYKHRMAFEFYERNLEMELNEKNKLEETDEYSKYFSEPEVWYVFDSLMSLEKSFVDMGYIHGDMQPKNCLIDPHGFIKLIDNSLINYGKTGYLKMVFEHGYHAILSPQLLEALKIKELQPRHNQVQSEVWSIGLTVLCAALNKDFEEFYDWPNYKIRFERLKDSYEIMRNIGFSEQLISTIGGCLEESEDRRSTLDEVIGFLLPYQDQIRKGQFSFHNMHANPNLINQSQPAEGQHYVEQIYEPAPIVHVESHYHEPKVVHVEKSPQKVVQHHEVVRMEPRVIRETMPVSTRVIQDTNVRASHVNTENVVRRSVVANVESAKTYTSKTVSGNTRAPIVRREEPVVKREYIAMDRNELKGNERIIREGEEVVVKS